MKSEVVATEHEMPANVLEAIREGRKIEAIKLLREKNGLGLANAKVLVDRATRLHGTAKPIPSFADQPAGPGAPTIALLVLLLVTAGLYFVARG